MPRANTRGSGQAVAANAPMIAHAQPGSRGACAAAKTARAMGISRPIADALAPRRTAGASNVSSRRAASAPPSPSTDRSRHKSSGTDTEAATSTRRGASSESKPWNRSAEIPWKRVGTKRESPVPEAACQAPDRPWSSGPPTGPARAKASRIATNAKPSASQQRAAALTSTLRDARAAPATVTG